MATHDTAPPLRGDVAPPSADDNPNVFPCHCSVLCTLLDLYSLQTLGWLLQLHSHTISFRPIEQMCEQASLISVSSRLQWRSMATSSPYCTNHHFMAHLTPLVLSCCRFVFLPQLGYVFTFRCWLIDFAPVTSSCLWPFKLSFERRRLLKWALFYSFWTNE